MKRKWWYSLLLLIPIASISTIATSCSQTLSIEKTENKEPDDKLEVLKVKNLFSKKINETKKIELQKEYKAKLAKVINDYRLEEWNKYFANQKNNSIKSKVLNLEFKDYSLKNEKDELIKNKIFNNIKKEMLWTQTYKKQDNQFRYFNDFINIINNEDNPNEKNKKQEDFLYLRWVYYTINASYKYHNLKVEKLNNKPIHEINFTDWLTAVLEAILGDLEPIKDLLFTFLEYYGLTPQGVLMPNSSSISECYLLSIDLVMRFASKTSDELKRYPLWKQKAIRAKEIYEITKDKYDLLSNSLNPANVADFDKDNPKWPSDVQIPDGMDETQQGENLQKAMKELTNFAEKLVEQLLKLLSSITTVKLSDYYKINNK